MRHTGAHRLIIIGLAALAMIKCVKPVPFNHLVATSTPVLESPQLARGDCWSMRVHLESDYPASDINGLSLLAFDEPDSHEIVLRATYGPRLLLPSSGSTVNICGVTDGTYQVVYPQPGSPDHLFGTITLDHKSSPHR